MEMTTPTDNAIRLQLEKIVTSVTFQGAQRAIRLLQFLVEQTLSGQASTLKGFTLGVDGLGRGPSFDPRTDSIARVEASRLRSRLKLYYAKDGALDSVHIVLPKGSYVPIFEPRPVAVEQLKNPDIKGDAAGRSPQDGAISTVPSRTRLKIMGAVLLLSAIVVVLVL